MALFTDDAKALKAWNPALGLSLANFVGLLAQRKVASILRSKRRMPWTEEPSDDALENVSRGSEPGADAQAGSRELLQRLFEHLQASLSPRGLELFYRLYVDEQSIEDVCAQTGLNASSVYQWKSRLGKPRALRWSSCKPSARMRAYHRRRGDGRAHGTRATNHPRRRERAMNADDEKLLHQLGRFARATRNARRSKRSSTG